MDGSDLSGDGRTFRADFTGNGVERLKMNVKGKLMELMGDYTDDALVDYVVVLLRNGRCKAEARKELNVFLGDKTAAFVSWLWDHLSSNLHLHVEQKSSFPDDLAKTKSLVNKRFGTHDSQLQNRSDRRQNYPENEKQEFAKLSRNRHNRESRGLVQEEMQPFFLQNVLNENRLEEKIHKTIDRIPEYEKQDFVKLSGNQHDRERRGLVQAEMQPFFLQTAVNESCLEEKLHQKTNLLGQSHPPMLQTHKKRTWQDERDQQPPKARSGFLPSVGPSSRLLQFALRDILRTALQTSPRTEPAAKRLCSRVSIPSANYSFEDRSQMTTPVSGAAGNVMNAAVEAAEDVLKVKCSRNIFGGEDQDIDSMQLIDQPSYFVEDVLEEKELDDIFQVPGPDYLEYYDRSEYDRELTGNITMLEGETMALDNDGYGLVGRLRHKSSSFSTENKIPFILRYSASKDMEKKTGLDELGSPSIASGKASRKIMNISVNVNTCNPPHYGSSMNHAEVEILPTGEMGVVRKRKPKVHLCNTVIFEKDSVAAVADVEKEFQRTVPSTPVADVEKEFKKTVPSTAGSYSASSLCDDVDSRIIFVSNVHFAATKHSLSRHFSKYGEVLKVIIVTDATTRQPKGSAFIEFSLKESAEQALLLNGTSFMSRVLKSPAIELGTSLQEASIVQVVRRNAACHEVSQQIIQPQIARTSLLSPMLQKVASPKGGLSSAFRGGPSRVFQSSISAKPGVRSLQWKRDSSAAQPADGVKKLQKVSPSQRSFTYVRSTSKPESNSGNLS